MMTKAQTNRMITLQGEVEYWKSLALSVTKGRTRVKAYVGAQDDVINIPEHATIVFGAERTAKRFDEGCIEVSLDSEGGIAVRAATGGIKVIPHARNMVIVRTDKP